MWLISHPSVKTRRFVSQTFFHGKKICQFFDKKLANCSFCLWKSRKNLLLHLPWKNFEKALKRIIVDKAAKKLAHVDRTRASNKFFAYFYTSYQTSIVHGLTEEFPAVFYLTASKAKRAVLKLILDKDGYFEVENCFWRQKIKMNNSRSKTEKYYYQPCYMSYV